MYKMCQSAYKNGAKKNTRRSRCFFILQEIFIPHEERDQLHVGRLGEHVHRLDLDEGVAEGTEPGGVPGEGGGIARDVHDAPGLHARCGAEHVLAASGTDRVAHDDVRSEPLLVELRHELSRVGGVKFRMADAVGLCIFLRIADGVGDDLDADDAPGFPGEAEGNGAGAAVGIDDRFLSGELREIEGRAVEHFRLLGIDLKEGIGRDLEAEAAQGAGQRFCAPEAADLRAEDDVARPALHIVVEGDHFRQGLPHFLDPFPLAGELHRGGDDDGHEPAVVAHAAHDVAHAALAGLFVVGADAVLIHEGLCEEEEPVIGLLLDGAGQGGDDGVAALTVVAEARPAVNETGGNGHFIPVTEGMRGGENRTDDIRGIASDFRDGAGSALPFGPELARIGEVGDLAAAAVRIDRAGRRGPVFGRGKNGLQPARGIGFLDGSHHSADRFARQRAGDEEGEAFVFPDAFAVDAQIVNGELAPFAGGNGAGRMFLPHHGCACMRSRARFAASRSSGVRPR